MAVDIDFSKPVEEGEEDKQNTPVNLTFAPSQTATPTPKPETPLPPAQPVKPKSWQENKKLAAVLLVIGLIIIVLVFYYLFSSAGII